jgi:hypothetical protein
MGIAIIFLVNVRKLVRLLRIECDDFSDDILELEYCINLEVVVQEEHLIRCLDTVNNKLLLVSYQMESGVV